VSEAIDCTAFSRDSLRIDPEREVAVVCKKMRQALSQDLMRRGLVVGLSGGIDSSVTVGLAVRAIGPDRVVALLMPERHSAPETLQLSKQVADHYGCSTIEEDITTVLAALGHYRKYEDAVRMVIPDYGAGWKSKIVVKSREGFSFFHLVAQSPGREHVEKRLTANAYLEIVAAMNFKQRTRKMLEYYHADRLNYAVAGTPNRLEYDQGFFVKQGDGAADIKPIAHLYKTQVYQLAEYLGVPETIRNRPPTTDTYSLPQGQDEFYFSVSHHHMDMCLYGKNHRIPPETVAQALELDPKVVHHIYTDIETKRASTRYLHRSPILVQDVGEVAVGQKH
jgi:NAD+ synthase